MPTNLTRRGFLGAAGLAGAASVAAGGLSAETSPKGSKTGAVKIIGVCCSHRKGKSTVSSMQVCLEAAKRVDKRIEVELIDLAGMEIDGSLAAGVPLAPGKKDDFPPLVPKLADPKVAGIIIGTPVYFGNMSSRCKAFLVRCMDFRKNDFALRNKVAGVLAVGGSRNGGQELTIQSVQAALFCQQLIIVGESRPGSHPGATVWSGKEKGDVSKDELGMASAESLGRRVAETALLVQ